ncbi:MAG: acyl-CoA thioesterase [Polyangiales bacterium]
MIIPPLDASAGPPPGRPVTRTSAVVRFAETDLMGIVHHANYLLYVEEARVAFLTRRGIDFLEWTAKHVYFPVVDARLRYRSAANFLDVLDTDVWIGETSRVTVRFDFRISRTANDKRTTLCEGYSTIACVDEARAPKRIPPEISAALVREEATR